jgi:hypothetical protein
MNSRYRILPLLYFAPLEPGARVFVVTDFRDLQVADFQMLGIDVHIVASGNEVQSCDVLVVDVAQSDTRRVTLDAAAGLRSNTTLVVCDRRRDITSTIKSAPRRFFGWRRRDELGRSAIWEFVVEPSLVAPRFLVRPGFKSDIPTSTDDARWRQLLRRSGLLYALPRDVVSIYAGSKGGGEPVLRALSNAGRHSILRTNVRSVYVSPTESLVVRADTQYGTVYARFPFSKRALERVGNASQLQEWVRSTGNTLPPEPIGIDVNGHVPYAVEAACRGRAWNKRDKARALLKALRAITDIHLRCASSAPQKLDVELFGRMIEPRIAAVETTLGAGRMEAVRHRLMEGLIGKNVLLSICHGDFKLENCLFEHGEISGIVDWDMGSREDLSVIDIGHLHARLLRKQSLALMAEQTECFAGGYAEYFQETRASFIEPRDLLLLWHVDQVAKEVQYGNASARWIKKHVPW